jgi:peptidoglycan/xylan/chitin deacetylase (PgdA/CDA1 family)
VKKTLGAAIGIVGAWALPSAAVTAGQVARLLGMQTHLRDPRGIALTFDDGPHPEGTPAVLDTLARLGAPAAFFLTGEQVERYPELAREISERGHTIGVHGHRHLLLPLRPPRVSAADLRLACAVIEHAAAVKPRLYRPPYGAANPAVLLAAHRAGLRPVLWARWGRDWERRATAASVAAAAARDLRGGEILLLHDSDSYAAPDSWRTTVAALPEIVAAVAQAGLTLRALH